MKERKVTLARLAETAGVSAATVTRITKGTGRVSPELRERVFHAASQLGLNLSQRNDSPIIAFLLSNRDVLHPFHSSVLVGVEACCASRNYGLLFLTLRYPLSAPRRSLHVPNILCRKDLIRGAVLAGTNSQSMLDFLNHAGIPFVILGNNLVDPPPDGLHNSVYFDDIGGAHEMTLYLQSLGHRDIWYIGNSRFPWFVRRKEGYAQAMIEAGVAPRVVDLEVDDPETLGYLATKSILKGGKSATALFAGDDTTARGAYKALRERGLRIPEDVSVVGFNETIEARSLHPPLTSVRVFTELVGRNMADLLLESIAHPTQPPKTVTIPTQVAKHESCGQVAVPSQSEDDLTGVLGTK